MFNVADIFASVRLNLETGEFEASAAKAADKTATSMGQRMGKTLKTVASGAIGSAIGLGVGMALSGAEELDAATRQLQADTGMTGEEARAAEHAMAGMFKTSLHSFEEIGQAMAAVHNDLGLVGEDADAATESFLKFSTATGQDAAGAVKSFDDILDAWNLTAEDSSALMDGLIADHQKFGGSIEESESALSAMAPAMQAANMQIDDGRALLNLFNAAGIDASKAPAMLAKAVKQLKPGQDLNDLIAQIASIEDPTERAQAAMKVFGARAGIGMAQALKPGMTGLSDYAISADEAAGKTDDAANAIESSFGNKFKLFMKGIQGSLAEFGTGFGDLIMIAAAFGPKLTAALLSGLGGLGGLLTKRLLPKITGALASMAPELAASASGLGTTMGAAMGAALPIALVAAAGVGIALAFKSIVLDPGLQKQTREIGEHVGEQIATGTQDQLLQSKAALQKGISDIEALPFGSFLYGDQIRDLNAQLDGVNAAIEKRAHDMGAAVPTEMAAGAEETMPEWSGKVEDIATFFGTDMKGVEAAAKQAGADGMVALASGIKSQQQAPLDAFNTLKDMLKNALTPMKEQARLAGELASKELAAGLKSGDPAVRAQAEAVTKMAADRLGEIAAGGGKAGDAAMKALEKQMRSKIPQVRDAAKAAKEAAQKKLEELKGPAGAAGAAAGTAYKTNLQSVVSSLKLAVNVVTSFFTGGAKHATGGQILGPAIVGEKGPELYVPPAQGRILTASESIAALSGMGQRKPTGGDVTVNVYNPAPEPASTSTRRELRKLALSGSPV